MPRPNLVTLDPNHPVNCHPSLRNQVAEMRWAGIRDWMMEVTLTEVIEMFWYCKELQAADLERKQRQAADVAAWARWREAQS